MLLDRLEFEARIWSWGIEFTIGIIMTTSWGFVTRNMIIREHICTNISFFLEPLQKDQKFFFFFSFWVWGGFLVFFFFLRHMIFVLVSCNLAAQKKKLLKSHFSGLCTWASYLIFLFPLFLCLDERA